jgi:hypothetical protein
LIVKDNIHGKEKVGSFSIKFEHIASLPSVGFSFDESVGFYVFFLLKRLVENKDLKHILGSNVDV